MKLKLFKNREDKYAKFDSSTKVEKKPRKNPLAKVTNKLNRGVFKNKAVRTVTNIFTKDALNKLSITLIIVIIYRALAAIPLPGIDMAVYTSNFAGGAGSQSNALFSLFTGGQLDSPSLVGLGLVAYINASIVMQLLPYAIPRLKEIQQEGERGRQVINQITRLITLPLSFFYSVAYLVYLSQRDIANPQNLASVASDANHVPLYLIPHSAGTTWPSIEKIIFMAIVLAAGTMFLMWLSELITERGLGNGSSIVITIGILANLPTYISTDFAKSNIFGVITNIFQGKLEYLRDPYFIAIIAVIIGLLVVIATLVFINESQRKIDIRYARRVRGEEVGQGSFLPIKFTITGVLPVIFATSLLSIPQIIVPLIENSVDSSSAIGTFVQSIKNGFLFASQNAAIDRNDLIFIAVEFLLVIVFGLFYAFIVLNPKETAENLQKSGAFVPGIRPGKSTERYITGVILRISFVGAIVLAIISIIPIVSRDILLSTTGNSLQILTGISGTGILIIVGVVLDTYRQYKSLKATRGYEKYIIS